MPDNPFAENPYQSPALAASPGAAFEGSLSRADIEKLKKFRQQMHALGGIWIFLGLFAAGLGAFVAVNGWADEESVVLVVVLLVSGVLHFGLGIMTVLKQMWAVYTGLVLSYISLLGNLFNLNLCALAILVAILIQAHRVIGWATDFKRRGIPLSMKV